MEISNTKAVSVTANRHEPCISQAPIRRQKPYRNLCREILMKKMVIQVKGSNLLRVKEI